ncbi:uncharacterized protein LOC112557662 [Pomacea canaliculata]|uniref:uncharacterized protein LOC112557662 n=1 Tax=Pomacea canaliculata TaxID=400727 RepID=UPI000D726167|nr:uncharacterized protein LOC112557662 [Pomacea canaliculata]
MWTLLILSPILGLAVCRPPADQLFGNFSSAPLSPEDRVRLEQLARPRAALPANFKKLYVSQTGATARNTRPTTGHWIEIVGSPLSSDQALLQVAREVSKMLAHSPPYIFNNIAGHDGAGVGIFTSEKLVIFPEFSNLADTPACKGRCDGSCAHTCTFDGRKFEDIAGVTSTRSVVLQDNVLCTARDPYNHHDNIVVHEFAHGVERFGLSAAEKNQLTTAYNNAKAHSLWTTSSYAMANQAEYFGEGTGAFFLVNMQSTTGGMTQCPGHTCRTEAEVRNFIHSHDPQLYNLLSHVYFNGNPLSPSGVTICP